MQCALICAFQHGAARRHHRRLLLLVDQELHESARSRRVASIEIYMRVLGDLWAIQMNANAYRSALLSLLIFGFLCDGHATSRHHDGDARVWIHDGALCIGANETYEVPGFFSRKAHLDQNQVVLYAVQVNRSLTQAWEASTPPGTIGSTVRLRPDTCIEYGQPIASFENQIPPQALEPDIYEVLLQAGDQKNRRAWFYKRFCLIGGPGNWSVRDTERLEGTHEWRCK